MWTDNTRNAKIKGGDQIEVFKILNGYENIDCNICFRNIRKHYKYWLSSITWSSFLFVWARFSGASAYQFQSPRDGAGLNYFHLESLCNVEHELSYLSETRCDDIPMRCFHSICDQMVVLLSVESVANRSAKLLGTLQDHSAILMTFNGPYPLPPCQRSNPSQLARSPAIMTCSASGICCSISPQNKSFSWSV